MTGGRPYEIAIIGMSCRFPGASDLSSYFENILSARDRAPEVPPERRNARVLCDALSQNDGQVPACRAEYLESPMSFDATERGHIMSRTIDVTKPAQCLLRGATLAALTDAGIVPDSLDDLSGACFVAAAARASSLAAVDRAARALLKHKVNLAIAGGVYVEAGVNVPPVIRQHDALSGSPASGPFAAAADGMISGEGVGIVVLKRRADAERDGDRIYAVIEGIGLANDSEGRRPGVSGVRGHASVLRRAYRRAGIDPSTVMFVEGHRLGIAGARRAELRALNAVFPPLPHGRRTLGSASSIIGHAMPVAGVAGLITIALALYHRVLPPTPRAGEVQPLLGHTTSTFAPNPVSRPWIHGDETTPRRAGVNTFGFAGINAHAVLEEHAASADGDRPGALRWWETEAILFSAPDRAGLIEQVRQLQSWLKHDSSHTLLDVAYSRNSLQDHPPGGSRLGLVASSLPELADRLTSVLPRLADPACRFIRDGRGIYYWDEPLLKGKPGGLAFLFPGEGSQYPGMLADLCAHFPEVRILFDTADRIARDLGEIVPPSEHLFGPMPGGDEKLWSTATAVNVVLNAQWALYQVLNRLGLRPDAVLGHSSGEILALSAGGVFQTDRALERKLGRLGAIMAGFESSGDLPEARLVAVASHRDRVEAICRELDARGLEIAMDNCPHQVVVAMPPAEHPRLVERLRRENILFEELPFSRAYHTPSFQPVVAPIAEFFDQMSFRPSCVPIYSCASRGRMPGNPEAIRDLAVAQWTQTVAFRETILAMHADGLRLFVDVGARGNLAGFVEDTLRGKPSFAVAANLPRRAGVTQLNHLVAATFAHGATLTTDYLYMRRRPRAIDWNGPESASRPGVEVKTALPEPTLAPELALRSGSTAQSPAPPDPYSECNGHGPEKDWGEGFRDVAPDDRAMLSFQDTMRAFLRTQHEVMTAYLNGSVAESDAWTTNANGLSPSRPHDGASSPEPGPWVGEIRQLVPGALVETVLILEAHDDPIAQHHTLGGRKISAVDPSLLGLPVLPFAVMAEMTAQVGALLATPGLVLTGLKAVRAHKWVRYEEEPVYLELRGRRLSSLDDERVWVGIFNRGTDGQMDATRPVFEAIAIFDESVPSPPPASAWSLANPRPSKFTARSVYAEQWLFHGPLFQAIAHMGNLSANGIEGRLRVLPLEPLVKKGQATTFHTDLVVIDNFTQLLGAWGLDYLAEGDVMFPLHMEDLEIYGGRPPLGTEVACQITIHELERHRIRVEAQFIRPDGTVWMRINDWEDWRFHWPGRYRDSFRQPRDYLIGEELPLVEPAQGQVAGARAVWLEPPADMGRPVWRDVLEFTQLGPDERAGYLASAGSDEQRSHSLWGRIAAKEAARRLWNDAGHPAVYPADLAIVAGEHGQPLLTRVGGPALDSLPAISIAHADGVAIALAALDPTARVGIGVEPIVEPPPNSEASAFTSEERALLDRWSGSNRIQWVARFWCAKQAAASASGRGLAGIPASARIIDAHEETGVIQVRLAPDLRAAWPDGLCDQPLNVVSALRAGRAWAWTIAEGAKP